MTKENPIRHDDGNADTRYSIRKEYTGHATPQWVARFCGEWIGSSQFYSSALMFASGHNARRNGALTIVEGVQ
jgi:hypothetical protein